MTDNRPSKKQRELLQFIDGFIKGYGYGPSYREIMRALGYKSVSTVAVHVDGLITRGYMRKTTHSARSLEIISLDTPAVEVPDAEHSTWLEKAIKAKVAAGIPDADKDALERAFLLLVPQPPKSPKKPKAIEGESTSSL